MLNDAVGIQYDDPSYAQIHLNKQPGTKGRNANKQQGRAMHWREAQHLGWRGSGNSIFDLVKPTPEMMEPSTYQCWGHLIPREGIALSEQYVPVLFDDGYVYAYLYQQVFQNVPVAALGDIATRVNEYAEEYRKATVMSAYAATAKQLAAQFGISFEDALDTIKKLEAEKTAKENGSANTSPINPPMPTVQPTGKRAKKAQ